MTEDRSSLDELRLLIGVDAYEFQNSSGDARVNG